MAAEAAPHRCGPTGLRILHIHPTLRCNLSCPHCYSNSGPSERQELPQALIEAVVSDAAGLGYEVLSVSGGEPFLYAGLAETLRHARSCGMRTSVTTNGHFLDPRHVEPLRDHLDVLAVSVDGPPDMHNFMRGSPRAFYRLCAGAGYVREAGIPFGFIHTVTQQSWIHLLWLAEFASQSGARLLQLHPLEMAGRAETRLRSLAVTEEVLYKTYLLSAALVGKYAGEMAVQVDLLHRDQALAHPALLYADDPGGADPGPPRVAGVLVLESDGAVVPLTYGFSRRYQVCDVRRQSLASAWPAFAGDVVPRLAMLCRQAFDELTSPGAEDLFNWHEKISAFSHRRPEPEPSCGALASATADMPAG